MGVDSCELKKTLRISRKDHREKMQLSLSVVLLQFPTSGFYLLCVLSAKDFNQRVVVLLSNQEHRETSGVFPQA